MSYTGPPLDLSLRAPSQECLEAVTANLAPGCVYSDLEFDQRAVVYGLAVQELQASGMLVLAQFLAGLT